mmetsp:Transcript_11811/g.23519  ORF Transcript_11811/g.23519 Transcript_11811/m.23519 type:complete len:237 (-) Transcript_11811:8-718(-)
MLSRHRLTMKVVGCGIRRISTVLILKNLPPQRPLANPSLWPPPPPHHPSIDGCLRTHALPPRNLTQSLYVEMPDLDSAIKLQHRLHLSLFSGRRIFVEFSNIQAARWYDEKAAYRLTNKQKKKHRKDVLDFCGLEGPGIEIIKEEAEWLASDAGGDVDGYDTDGDTHDEESQLHPPPAPNPHPEPSPAHAVAYSDYNELSLGYTASEKRAELLETMVLALRDVEDEGAAVQNQSQT